MKLGIMQPYFAPYIGYWQLLNAVDTYILYDDVNYIKGGWINRNRILYNGEIIYFNIPMKGASSNKHINEIFVNTDRAIIAKNLRTINAAYRKAPYYEDVYNVLVKIMDTDESNLARYIKKSIDIFCDYIGIKTNILMSSEIEKRKGFTAEENLIILCKMFNVNEYYNAVGGQALYSAKHFGDCGIKLSFLKAKEVQYKQLNDEFIPNLSIIDILMNNSVEQVRAFLSEYTLISNVQG